MKNAIPRVLSTTSLAVVSVAVVSGCTIGAGNAESLKAPSTKYQVTWGKCEAERTKVGNLSDDVQCGTIELPVDWNNPDGEHFTTRVYKEAAKGVSKGTLLYFPSGPGETADVGFTNYGETTRQYDKLGVDPRGVASTAAVTCNVNDLQTLPIAPPLTERRFDKVFQASKKIASECATTPASLKEHLDAYSYARDVEAVRSTITKNKVVVSGYSYGTLQAARYLELFGDKVDGAVLQGVMSPGEPVREFQQTAARGLQQLFDEFAQWCTRSRECTVPKRDASSALAQAQERADRGQLSGKTPFGKKWDSAGVIQAFELRAGNGDFPAAAEVLRQLAAGNTGQQEATDGQMPSDRSHMVFPDRIVCSDFDLGIRDASTARRIFTAISSRQRDIGLSTNAAQYSVICAGAPQPDSRTRNKFVAKGAFPILLLSNRIDPSTPKEWAHRVEKQLNGRGKHIVSNRIGHGNATADPAVTREVEAYFGSL